MIKLDRDFYERETTLVAQELLGKYLVHSRDGIEQIARIVEVEAYIGQHDLACHASKGITTRTQVMFGPAGYAYIYLIYGVHYCMNVVTEKEGVGAAVLLRALEPIQNVHGKTQGPGLLSKAMRIDKSLNQHDMLSHDFYIAQKIPESAVKIVKRPRIGVHYAKEWANELLRFYIKDNVFISKP